MSSKIKYHVERLSKHGERKMLNSYLVFRPIDMNLRVSAVCVVAACIVEECAGVVASTLAVWFQVGLSVTGLMVRGGTAKVYVFLMDIILTSPWWQKYLAAAFLLGVMCVIIGAWMFLIYNEFQMNPEKTTWMRGTVFGKVVMDTYIDLKATFKTIGKGFQHFFMGFFGAAIII
jgi:hypothetical protein